MNVMEKTAGLDYAAEYNRLKEEMVKQNEENKYLREELKDKERKLQYYYGFEAACKLIWGRRCDSYYEWAVKMAEKEVDDQAICGATNLPCIRCNPGGCDNRKEGADNDT